MDQEGGRLRVSTNRGKTERAKALKVQSGTPFTSGLEWKSLVEKLDRWGTESNEAVASLPELKIHNWQAPTDPVSYTLEPSICIIAQGAKRVVLGEDVFIYDAHTFLITSVDLPLVGQVTEASRAKPYLAMTLKLDLPAIAQLVAEDDIPRSLPGHMKRGIVVARLSQPLWNAFHRLVDLLDEPGNIPILAPLIQREIHYRLLVSDQGPRLRQIAAEGSRGNQISKAIAWVKGNLNQRLRIQDLAERIGMSTSAFHQHFQEVTAMSPLQFQKRLRLHEARRLMLTERMDAATVSFRVGYESPSQFSREYRRLFGSPPLQDIKRLSQTVPVRLRRR